MRKSTILLFQFRILLIVPDASNNLQIEALCLSAIGHQFQVTQYVKKCE